MQDTNWELLKFKYEVLGNDLDQIAEEHQVSPAVLKYNAKDWKQIPLARKEPLNLEELKSLEDVLSKLGEETAAHTKAFAILKQKFLGPKYVELETVLLHKAIEMAQGLSAQDPRGAATLKNLASILTELLAKNPLLTVGTAEEITDPNNREWKITVVDSRKDGEEDADTES
jgi:hypothetical protein